MTGPPKVLYSVPTMLSTASITDLKQNTAKIINKIKEGGKSVAILQRSQVAAVLVDPEYYSILEQALENSEDIKSIDERKSESTVSFEEVANKLDLE